VTLGHAFAPRVGAAGPAGVRWLASERAGRSAATAVEDNALQSAVDVDDHRVVAAGRLPGCTRLATGLPCASVGLSEKSVRWSLSRKPFVICMLPKALSMVVVIAIALPRRSTMEMWLVEGSSGESSLPRGSAPAGVPGAAGFSRHRVE